jgi:hypothetical protein
MKLFSKLAAASALALSMVVAAPASAAVYISVNGTNIAGAGNPWDADDGLLGTGEICSIMGVNCGGFESISITGSAPLGRPGLLHTNAVEVNTGNSGNASVEIWITRTGLSPLGVKQYLSYSNNNQGGRIATDLSMYASSTNALFGGTQLGSSFISNVSGSNSNNQTTFADLSAPGTYSVSQRYIITASNAANERSASPTMTLAVPEPGTWALMIMGFGGAGAMLRSRRKALAAV